jgi:hypothetical protein
LIRGASMDQPSFASLDFAGKKKRTKRDVFLAEMAAVVRWGMLEAHREDQELQSLPLDRAGAG